jgi:hypothetical protein
MAGHSNELAVLAIMMAPRLVFLSLPFVLSLVLEGCASSESKTRSMNARLADTAEAIVIFPNSMGAASPEDVKFSRCVERAFLRNMPNQRFVDHNAFRDALFPWFEANTAPRTPDELNQLLAKPLVQSRISQLGVGYVIAIAGGTTEKGGLRPFACGYIGGCIGLSWWDRRTNLTVLVWNLEKGGEVGEVEAKASGTAIMPAFLVPIPYIPMTETTACKELGRRLVELLAP